MQREVADETRRMVEQLVRQQTSTEERLQQACKVLENMAKLAGELKDALLESQEVQIEMARSIEALESDCLDLRERTHRIEDLDAIEGKVWDLDMKVDSMASDVDHLTSTHP